MGKTYDVMLKGDAIHETKAMCPMGWFSEKIPEDQLDPISLHKYLSQKIIEYSDAIEMIKENQMIILPHLQRDMTKQIQSCSSLVEFYSVVETFHLTKSKLFTEFQEDEVVYMLDAIVRLKAFQKFLEPYMSNQYFGEISY